MIQWNDAPEWADKHGVVGVAQWNVWFNDEQYSHVGSGKIHHFGGGVVWARDEIKDITHRPDEPIRGSTNTPTLETMLAEWRDLEARAQAAQAEADALFEHAGQCHGEIVVRLAELGWGKPRMVPGEPVVTLDDSDGWVVNGHIAPAEATHFADYWGNPYWYYFKDGLLFVKDAENEDDTFDPREIYESDRNELIPSMISRPSTQP